MKRNLPLFLLLCIGWVCIGWVSIAGAASGAGPVLHAKLEKTVVVPGQTLSFSVTVLVPTWMPKPPEFPSFELPDASVQLPEGSSRPTMERVDGVNWSGVTRDYQISPMVVGHFRIPPQTIRITYADPETLAPVVAKLRTKEFAFEGRSPAGAEDLDPFIAAESLSLEQEVEGDPEDLEPGSAFTRIVTARLTGASPIFLPPLIPAFESDGLAAYPKEPVFTESQNRGRTTGERVESVTYVAEAGGRFTAAPIRLRWWNLRTREIEVAELPALEIVSRGPPPVLPSTVDVEELAPWFVVGGLFLLIAGAAGRWLWPRYAERRKRQREDRLASEAFAFAELIRALRSRRLGDVIRAVELWSMRLPMLSEEDRADVFEPLDPLGASVYGREPEAPSRRQWSDARASLRRKRRAVLAKARTQEARRGLPSLNPLPKVSRSR